jgi:hypothetical protein
LVPIGVSTSFNKIVPKDLNTYETVGLTLSAGVEVYRKFYTEEKENSYGVLAISVSKPTSQPYVTMTDILAVSASLQSFIQNFLHISYRQNIFILFTTNRCHVLFIVVMDALS